MKLLVSDYDKTLKYTSIDLKLNIKSLKKFINDGNIFLLNTGRSYESIMKEIKKYKIPYDYLSCSDGNILFDKENKVIYSEKLNKNILKSLKKINVSEKFKINTINFSKNILEYEIIISNLNELFLFQLKEIMVKYNLCYKVFKECGVFKIYVYDKLISKSKPIEYLKKELDILDNNIYTIGDDINDLEMIRDYQGYGMIWSKKEIKKVCQKRIICVSKLIEKIRKNN